MRATAGERKKAADRGARSTVWEQCRIITMPGSRKINLEKVLASLDAVCPKCGKVISPAEVRPIDFEHVEWRSLRRAVCCQQHGLPTDTEPGWKLDREGAVPIHWQHRRRGTPCWRDPRQGIFDATGNLYGTTRFGGNFSCRAHGCGVVYKLAPNSDGAWKETVLHNFFDHPAA
jgi:uncharacterized repeat protein (TIGR03803 family)